MVSSRVSLSKHLIKSRDRMFRWNIQQRRAAELYRLSSGICMSIQNRWLSSAVLSWLLHARFGSGLSHLKSFCWNYLRRGKYVLWEHESTGKCFHMFCKCFYGLIETGRACFLFLLENYVKKKTTTCLLWLSWFKFSLLTPSLCQQLVLVLCFYLHVVTETQF